MKRDHAFYQSKRKRALQFIVAIAGGKTYSEVAKEQSVSASRISQIVSWGVLSILHDAETRGLIPAGQGYFLTVHEIRSRLALWEKLSVIYASEL